MRINFTTQVLKEDRAFVAYSPEFDLASCGKSVEEAKGNLREALAGFLESAKDRGVLREIMEEAGYRSEGRSRWSAPEFLSFERSELSMRNV